MTNTGRPSRRSSPERRSGSRSNAARRGRRVVDLGHPDRGHQLLEEDLVQAHRRRGDAGADVGHVERLEQPLDGPVLAERAVQHGERDVGAEQARGRG